MKRNTVIIAIVALALGVSIGYLIHQPPTESDAVSTTTPESIFTYDTTSETEPTPAVTPAPTKPYTSFADGLYEVNVDINPGIYKTDGIGESCYYARLSSLAGGSNIIDNEITEGPSTVEVLASDKGFKSDGCGSWKLVE